MMTATTRVILGNGSILTVDRQSTASHEGYVTWDMKAVCVAWMVTMVYAVSVEQVLRMMSDLLSVACVLTVLVAVCCMVAWLWCKSFTY